MLIGADTFPPNVNGAATFTSKLAAGLTARGHDVHVEAPAFSRKHGRFIEEHDGEKITVHRVYSWRWYPHDWLRFVLPWRSQAHAARILDEVKPDVVHIQSHIVIGRGLARQAHKRGIRVVATNHFMPENLMEHTLLPSFLNRKAVADRVGGCREDLRAGRVDHHADPQGGRLPRGRHRRRRRPCGVLRHPGGGLHRSDR